MGQGLDSVVHLFRRLLGSAPAAATDDSELLDAFVRRRDESAFAELVRRHGPLVLGVCRRVLHDTHDAEDAFQAVFLILARKAGSLGAVRCLGKWLYTVTRNLALDVRMRVARRRVL